MPLVFKILIILITYLVSIQLSFAQPFHPIYRLEWAANGEDYVVNNEIYDPKTFCDTMQANDPVIIMEGDPDSCVSAKIYNLRSGEVCDVWCE